MSTVDKVKAARSPAEALLAIAEALDELLEQRSEFPSAWSMPWSIETKSEEPKVKEADEYRLTPTLTPDKAQQIADLAAAIAAAPNEQERAALQAELKLLLDTGGAPEPVDEGRRAQLTVEEDSTTVDLPAVSPAKFVQRLKFAKDTLRLNEMLPEGEDWESAYAKGGPLWLYYGNRDYVMGLSIDVRREMVRDVLEESPTEAAEMSRDVLKATDGGEMSPNGIDALGEFSPDT